MKEDFLLRLFFAMVFYLIAFVVIGCFDAKIKNPKYSNRKSIMQKGKKSMIVLVILYTVVWLIEMLVMYQNDWQTIWLVQ